MKQDLKCPITALNIVAKKEIEEAVKALETAYGKVCTGQAAALVQLKRAEAADIPELQQEMKDLQGALEYNRATLSEVITCLMDLSVRKPTKQQPNKGETNETMA